MSISFGTKKLLHHSHQSVCVWEGAPRQASFQRMKSHYPVLICKKKKKTKSLCETDVLLCNGCLSWSHHLWVRAATNGLFGNSEYVLYQTFLTVLSFLSPRPPGYHVSSSVVLEEARWESRHLLQEDNESRLYPEPEKNCTEPGERGERWKSLMTLPLILH